MHVVLWLVEGTWEGCIDAAAPMIPADARVSLLYVIPEDVHGAADAALGGLMGRWRPGPAPTEGVVAEARTSGEALLEAAAGSLGRANVDRVIRQGRVEREVVRVAGGADLLVAARDGDRSRLGPHSLGPATRFVVDHAPCPLLLVWPEETPDVVSIPTPFPERGHPPPPPHGEGTPPPPPRK